MQLKTILRQVPDPRGKQGQDYMLWSILSLIVVSLLCGRRGMKAAFLLGRSLSRRQRAELGFIRGTTPCHATLTETLRVIDAQALADVLGALCLEGGGNARHIAIDGKTMRASKDSEGKAEHVLSAFCGGLQTVLGHEASRSKGLEIPDALKLLERLDLKGKIVTGDAIFCQKSIAAKIVERGGDYVFPVKDNQKTLRQDIETAFNEPVFPLCSWNSGVEKAHGRIEWRAIDVLLTEAAGIQGEWPTVRQICRIIRSRQVKKNGEWQKPQHRGRLYRLQLARQAASPQALLGMRSQMFVWPMRFEVPIKTGTWVAFFGEEQLREPLQQRSSQHFLPSPASVLKILKSVYTLANPRHRALSGRQKNRAIRLFSVYINRPANCGHSLASRSAPFADGSMVTLRGQYSDSRGTS